MRQFFLMAGMAVLLCACSMDEESKAKLDNAAKNAKQAAKEVGEVVSKQTAEVHEKWKEMNKDRIREAPKEDLGFESKRVDVDMEGLKQRVKAAKDAFMKEPEQQEQAAGEANKKDNRARCSRPGHRSEPQ